MPIMKFSKVEENRYKLESFKNDLIHIRVTLIICIIFYTLFGIVDFNVNISNPWSFMKIRFLLVNPIFFICFLLSYTKSFYKIHQLCITIAYIIAGQGIVIMLILAPNNHSYYSGLFLIFATGHLLTRMRLVYVTIGSFIIILSYALATAFYIQAQNPYAYIYLFFYLGVYILNVLGSIENTQFKREKYKQVYILFDDKIVLEKQIYDNLIQVETANRITTLSLAKLAEVRDKYTGDHIERVGKNCFHLALQLNDDIYLKNNTSKQEFLKSIELASILHDIGKISITEEILMKKGKLTYEEMEIMKTHSACGRDMLEDIHEKYDKNNFVNMGIEICESHHEHWDGKGYPNGLSGKNIPLSARIVSIVDVFDALRNERPYKKAYSLEVSLNIIKEDSGKKFDPELVKVFLALDDLF